MVKYICLKMWAFIIALVINPMITSVTKANDKTSNSNIIQFDRAQPKLFIEPYLNTEGSFQIAGHRSHRSHSSHRSHYSSRGGYGSFYKSIKSVGNVSKSVPNTTKSVSNPSKLTPNIAKTTATPQEKTTQSISSDKKTQESVKNVVETPNMNKQLIIAIQKSLKKLGYYDNEATGNLDEDTKSAILLYKIDKSLTPDEKIDQTLIDQIIKDDKEFVSNKEIIEKNGFSINENDKAEIKSSSSNIGVC